MSLLRLKGHGLLAQRKALTYLTQPAYYTFGLGLTPHPTYYYFPPPAPIQSLLLSAMVEDTAGLHEGHVLLSISTQQGHYKNQHRMKFTHH